MTIAFHAHHLVHDGRDIIYTIRDWLWPIMVVGYYLIITFMAFNGAAREQLGVQGRHARIHYLIWQYHTGLAVHPMRTYGGEKRLTRTASATNRATPEGQVVYWNPHGRWYRIIKRNLIALVVITFFYGLIVNTEDTVKAASSFTVVAAFATGIDLMRRGRKRVANRPARVLKTKPLTARVPAAAAAAGVGKEGTMWSVAGAVTDQKPTLADGIPTPVMATLLARPLGISTEETAKRMTIGTDKGHVDLPDFYAATDKQREEFEEVARANTKGSIQFTWRTNVSPRFVEWEPVETNLPRVAIFREYANKMEKLDNLTFGIGLTATRKMFTETHGGDLTWWVRSAGPGTGKSTGFEVKVAQICHRDPDADVYCIDTKQVSFENMHNIPNVHIFDDPEAQMGKIWGVFGELTGIMRDRYSAVRRKQINRATGKPFRYEDFSNAWVLVDEGNDLATMLKTYWMNVLKQPGDPMSPPIWSMAVAPLLNMGRQCGFHGEWMFQNLTDKALGGVSLRDSFPVRAMAGYTPNQWTRVVGSKYKEPKLGPGRICMCKGPDEIWVQGFWDEHDYLRAYALNGRQEVEEVAA